MGRESESESEEGEGGGAQVKWRGGGEVFFSP